jgi:hypothetical protein
MDCIIKIYQAHPIIQPQRKVYGFLAQMQMFSLWILRDLLAITCKNVTLRWTP